MKLKSLLPLIAGSALTFGSLTASVDALPIVYEGSLTSGTAVTGSVGMSGWINEVASEVDFWRFMANAGNLVTIRGTRGSPNLDPALSLYFGVTTADQALFLNDADWGGLTYLTFADDEVSVPAGPGGDPLLSMYRVPFTGNYTIAIGGFNSSGGGAFPYTLTAQIVAQAVPAPATIALLVGALLAFAPMWRRRA